MATNWRWDEDDKEVWIVQREREPYSKRTTDNRVHLTRKQIAKLAKEFPIESKDND